VLAATDTPARIALDVDTPAEKKIHMSDRPTCKFSTLHDAKRDTPIVARAYGFCHC